jgi:phosphoribosylformylglycinamidine cyclo-ligase
MIEQVNYAALDSAKSAFIEASRKTMRFAQRFGFVPDDRLGASANIFALDLRQFLDAGADKLYITLLPEGLGTADDARPDDLSSAELVGFWRNIGLKTMGCLTNDAASSGMQTILISLYLPSSNPERVFSKPFLEGFLGGFVETSRCKNLDMCYFSIAKICRSGLRMRSNRHSHELLIYAC